MFFDYGQETVPSTEKNTTPFMQYCIEQAGKYATTLAMKQQQ